MVKVGALQIDPEKRKVYVGRCRLFCGFLGFALLDTTFSGQLHMRFNSILARIFEQASQGMWDQGVTSSDDKLSCRLGSSYPGRVHICTGKSPFVGPDLEHQPR